MNSQVVAYANFHHTMEPLLLRNKNHGTVEVAKLQLKFEGCFFFFQPYNNYDRISMKAPAREWYKLQAKMTKT